MRILVVGVINLETSLQINEFPIKYNSLNFVNDKISSNLGGVGFNIVKSLSILGSTVRLSTLTAGDIIGELIDFKLQNENIEINRLNILSGTPQSVVIYDKDGKRQINTDLKDIHLKTDIDSNHILNSLENISFAVLTNVVYSKSFVKHCIERNIPFATDLQAIDHYSNEYNNIFMRHAEILFLSNDNLKCPEEEFINYVFDNYKAKIVCIGQGKEGLLLGIRNQGIKKYDAPQVEVVNSIGAGDALFSSFLHFYLKGQDPNIAIKKSLIFVGEKLKTKNSSLGFIKEERVNEFFKTMCKS